MRDTLTESLSWHRLTSQLAASRAMTDALFRIVRPEALYDRPIAERHRIVFYIGHLEAFDWNLIVRRALGREAFHPQFDKLFAFGIDPVDGNLPSDQPKDWPALAEVYGYRDRVRSIVDDLLAEAAEDGRRSSEYRERLGHGQLLHVAIEHRLMHAETLAYMFHQLPYDRKFPQAAENVAVSEAFRPRVAQIPAGTATLGLARDGEFGWDNEFDEHRVSVPGFCMDAFKVTNGEYLDFLRTGSYRERRLWTDADWAWKEAARITHPAFWVPNGKTFRYRGMFAEMDLPLDWPVYVSHAEASAYARWAGKALPTEAQWHRAAFGTLAGDERAYPWGDAAPRPEHGNFDFQRWDPAPVHAYPAGRSAFGVEGLLGNGWEWTSTVFGPFAGFERFDFYPGYSADFFDGKHLVMKGGSARTAAPLLRRSFRNWFQSHYQYMYAGFRCVSE